MGMRVVERRGLTGEDLWPGIVRMAWTGRAEARGGADRSAVCYRMAAGGELVDRRAGSTPIDTLTY